MLFGQFSSRDGDSDCDVYHDDGRNLVAILILMMMMMILMTRMDLVAILPKITRGTKVFTTGAGISWSMTEFPSCKHKNKDEDDDHNHYDQKDCDHYDQKDCDHYDH